MNTLPEIWSSVYSILFRGIFISLTIILIVKLIFKKRIDTDISINIVRILLIIHSLVNIILLVSSFLFNNLDNAFWTRFFGVHWWTYWIMMVMNSLLPLTLLMKKLSKNILYIFLVSILMNMGWIFESLVIHLTNMEREYINENYNPFLPSNGEIYIIFKSIIIGIFILIVGNLIKMKNHTARIKEK